MSSLCEKQPPYAGANYRWKTALSCAGIVYFHYGHRVLSEMLEVAESDDKTFMMKRIFEKTYTDFVEAVDAIDNGILPAQGGQL